MINGIDLLFIIIGFVLLFLLVEGWDRYRNWSEWDRDRRRQRRYRRFELRDNLDERIYRSYLHRLAIILQITCSTSKFNDAMRDMSKSFEEFNKALRGETHAQ